MTECRTENGGEEAQRGRRLLRFKEIKKRGIAGSRVQAKRMMDGQGFPKPIRLGPNSVAWIEAEVETWIAKRVAERDSEVVT